MINYEEKYKNQIYINLNNLENLKASINFQCEKLRNEIKELEICKNAGLYIRNKTKNPVFVKNFKIINFVSKKELLENVSEGELVYFFNNNILEEIDEATYLKLKNLNHFNSKEIDQNQFLQETSCDVLKNREVRRSDKDGFVTPEVTLVNGLLTEKDKYNPDGVFSVSEKTLKSKLQQENVKKDIAKQENVKETKKVAVKMSNSKRKL